jgi:4-amino-4-deoxy-L-arabinose transferase-like glycosyltransferase
LYVSNVVPFCAANLLTADSLLTFFETLAALAFVSMWQAQNVERARIWRRVMWLAFAFAFMTKGPPALLPLVALVIFRKTSALRFPSSMIGFDGPMVLLALGLPWFAYMAGHDPRGFGAFYRPLIEGAGSGPWYESFVVYGPVLFAGLVPWGLIALVLALTQYRQAIRAYFDHIRWQRFRQIHQESLFLLIWFFVPLLILCLIRVRLWLFVLPLLVPMSLLIGRALQHVRVKRWMAISALAWAFVLVAIKGYAPQYEGPSDARNLAQAIRAQLPSIPLHMAALDVPPVYGLKFYLGINLTKLSSGPLPDASFDKTALSYLQKPNPARYWMVAAQSAASAQDWLKAQHVTSHQVLVSSGYAVLEVALPKAPVPAVSRNQ